MRSSEVCVDCSLGMLTIGGALRQVSGAVDMQTARQVMKRLSRTSWERFKMAGFPAAPSTFGFLSQHAKHALAALPIPPRQR